MHSALYLTSRSADEAQHGQNSSGQLWLPDTYPGGAAMMAGLANINLVFQDFFFNFMFVFFFIPLFVVIIIIFFLFADRSGCKC